MSGVQEKTWCVVGPLAPLDLDVPVQRLNWPLHLTVLANFLTTSPQGALNELVRPVAARTGPIGLQVGSPAGFGPDRDIPVRLIDNGQVQALHVALHHALCEASHFRAESPHFHLEGFRPHITDWHAALTDGESFTMSSLVLAEVTPDAGIPRAVHPLNGRSSSAVQGRR